MKIFEKLLNFSGDYFSCFEFKGYCFKIYSKDGLFVYDSLSNLVLYHKEEATFYNYYTNFKLKRFCEGLEKLGLKYTTEEENNSNENVGDWGVL